MVFSYKPADTADGIQLGTRPRGYENLKDHSKASVSSDAGQNGAQISQWGIGWKTTSLICGPWILALVIAIVHLILFKYLNGKYEDDPGIPSQTYVTSASTIMANIVGTCIRVCLGAAFTQYFWRLVRISSLKLQTIEDLYTLRSNLMSLFSLDVFQKGGLLLVISLILWAIPVGMSFPPGAMTIRNTMSTTSGMQQVPTLDLEDTWNGNLTLLQEKSFAYLYSRPWRFARPVLAWFEIIIRPSLSQLAMSVMVNGDAKTMSSPCGLNCSYTIAIDSPWFECNTTTQNGSQLVDRSSDTTNLAGLAQVAAFEAQWAGDPNSTIDEDIFQTFYRTAADATTSSSNDTFYFNYTETAFSCKPRRARLHVLQTFLNGQQSSTIHLDSIHDLQPLNTYTYMTSENVTSSPITSRLRDQGCLSLLMAMTRPLLGSYNCVPYDTRHYKGIPHPAVFILSGSRNDSMADSTRLYNFWSDSWISDLVLSGTTTPFSFDTDLLNSYLANITISAISQFQMWSTAAHVTRTDLRPQFTFSRPINLILPYFLILAATLPLAVLGVFSLKRNGVPATDNGFLQILMTTRGSREVDKLAAGGCLGGGPNEPARLKELEVRYGELVGPNEDLGYSSSIAKDVFLAGFGVKDEVAPLQVGNRYGAKY